MISIHRLHFALPQQGLPKVLDYTHLQWHLCVTACKVPYELSPLNWKATIPRLVIWQKAEH